MDRDSDFVNDVQIRPMETDADVDALVGLAHRIWREVFPPIIGPEQTEIMLEFYHSRENILEEIAGGARYFFVCRSRDTTAATPVGYLAYEIQEPYLFLSKIYLLASERGKGLSSALFDWTYAEARAAGKDRVHLHVNKGNAQAIEVYLHKGFTVVDERLSPIGNGVVMDDYFMEKAL
ncbi:MAG: GNAT family N-acetyltransferase [Clostridiales Family XIII bacterium]|nr:GNAT family N-acetyltransferase [Clostridiales Family XIII bacterium]